MNSESSLLRGHGDEFPDHETPDSLQMTALLPNRSPDLRADTDNVVPDIPNSKNLSPQNGAIQSGNTPKENHEQNPTFHNKQNNIQSIPHDFHSSKGSLNESLDQGRSRGHRFRFSQLATDFWVWETLAWIVSSLSLLAIILMLYTHQNRSLPDWPFSITINSLVAIFATINKATLLYPIIEGIGQTKWNWFRNHEKALTDIEVFDEASRGPWGAIQMVWHIRWRSIGSIGALATILATALNPVIQQSFYYSQQNSPAGPSRVGLRTLYDDVAGTLEIHGITPFMQAAITRGIYVGQTSTTFGDPLGLTPVCPSANCSYPTFESLAVCSQCADISEQLTKKSDFEYSLPNGHVFQQSSGLRGISDLQFNSSGQLNAVTLDTGASIVNLSVIVPNVPSYVAYECTLSWCVHTYNSSVHNSIFKENILRTWNNSVPHAKLDSPVPGDGAPLDDVWGIPTHSRNYTFLANEFLNKTGDTTRHLTSSTFFIEQEANGAISSWISDLLTGTVTKQGYKGVDRPSSDVAQRLYDSIRLLPDGQTVSDSYNISGLSSLFSRTSQSMTTAVRQNTTGFGYLTANGTYYVTETVLKVRWAWFALPACLEILALVFLVLTVISTKRQNTPAWKTSTLALLFHGLGGKELETSTEANRRVDMERVAERKRVVLDDTSEGWKLVRP